MARSRGGRGRKSGKRNVDWVVNDDTYNSALTLPNGGQILIPLTLPKFVASYTDPTFAVGYGNYMWPEQDSGQMVYAVRGEIIVTPTAWAVGTAYRAIMRLVKKPVEYAAAFQAIVDPNYSLFQAEFANERFLWQNVLYQSFNLGDAGETVNINWKGVCALEPDESLFLAIENQSGITQTLLITPFFRTLMRADG